MKNLLKNKKILWYKTRILLISFAVSLPVSFLSFYLYNHLSKILAIEESGFLGFFLIGLITAVIAVCITALSSYLRHYLIRMDIQENKYFLGINLRDTCIHPLTILVFFFENRFIFTMVLSITIYCLVDSYVLLHNNIINIGVIQFIAGLLSGLAVIFVPGYFLEKKVPLTLTIHINSIRTMDILYPQFALARQLIGNPQNLTLNTFQQACEILRGINPKLDEALERADKYARTLSFLKGGSVIGYFVSVVPLKSEEDEKQKEKVLTFIDLVNDIRDEAKEAFITLQHDGFNNSHNRQLDHSNLASAQAMTSSISGAVTTSVATLMVVTVAVIHPFYMVGDSMSPTLTNGEYFMASSDISTIIRGNIIVFNLVQPDKSTVSMVKRVIGLPGETIMVQNGNVYTNGKHLDESAYLPSGTQTYGVAFLKDGISYTIPADAYVVMGDNRGNSSDSRDYGYVFSSTITGKVILNANNAPQTTFTQPILSTVPTPTLTNSHFPSGTP